MTKLVLDTGALVCFLSNGRVPTGGADASDESARRRKVDFLRQCLARRTVGKIIVPTPVLAEVYSASTAVMRQYMPLLQNRDIFEIVNFSERAAFRLGEVNLAIQRVHGDKWGGLEDHAGGWQRLKFDRQIFVCAELAEADAIYTDDTGLINLCRDQSMHTVQIEDWPESPATLFT